MDFTHNSMLQDTTSWHVTQVRRRITTGFSKGFLLLFLFLYPFTSGSSLLSFDFFLGVKPSFLKSTSKTICGFFLPPLYLQLPCTTWEVRWTGTTNGPIDDQEMVLDVLPSHEPGEKHIFPVPFVTWQVTRGLNIVGMRNHKEQECAFLHFSNRAFQRSSLPTDSRTNPIADVPMDRRMDWSSYRHEREHTA